MNGIGTRERNRKVKKERGRTGRGRKGIEKRKGERRGKIRNTEGGGGKRGLKGGGDKRIEVKGPQQERKGDQEKLVRKGWKGERNKQKKKRKGRRDENRNEKGVQRGKGKGR